MLHIRTFGGLNISYGEKMSLVTGRNTKMWELLKYVLACYPNPVTIDKLIEAVWPDDSANDDPAKNIRDIVYRLRRVLSRYGGEENYILFTNGCYIWNRASNCYIDFVEFNKYLREAEEPGKSDEERIASYNAVISLYQGEFMGEKWSVMETWAANFVSFYRRLFLQAVDSLGYLYENRLDYESVISLYNRTILVEPYEESLYTRQIQVLIKNGEYALAKRQYRQIEKFFLKEFQIAPSQTLQRLYEEAIKADIRRPVALSKIKERFDESNVHSGPILCAPDTFRHIYRFGKRADERVPIPVFLGKMTLLSDGTQEFSKIEYEQAMKTTLRILLENLRKGDIVCRYSSNQFLLMLTTKNTRIVNEGLNRIDELFGKEAMSSHFSVETEIVRISEIEE